MSDVIMWAMLCFLSAWSVFESLRISVLESRLERIIKKARKRRRRTRCDDTAIEEKR